MEKLKRSRWFNRLNSMSIRMSFVLYALFSLLIGIIICIFLISMVDRYRINLNYKYENMSTRYDIPENGSFTATYSNAKSDIAISVVIENNNLVISVSDDGCGFKNIEIEKATLPFYKSSKDISTEHLGLGLNISKILSERHGGNIQIANNKAGGACVTVKINCNES